MSAQVLQKTLSAEYYQNLKDNISVNVWMFPATAPQMGDTVTYCDLDLLVEESVLVTTKQPPLQRVRLRKLVVDATREWEFAGKKLKPYHNGAQDWSRLEARYLTNKLYKSRSVPACIWLMPNDFKDWLVMNGAEILDPASNERLRFRAGGYLGIIYSSRAGNLMAHDICMMFDDYRQNTLGEYI